MEWTLFLCWLKCISVEYCTGNMVESNFKDQQQIILIKFLFVLVTVYYKETWDLNKPQNFGLWHWQTNENVVLFLDTGLLDAFRKQTPAQTEKLAPGSQWNSWPPEDLLSAWQINTLMRTADETWPAGWHFTTSIHRKKERLNGRKTKKERQGRQRERKH